MSETKEVFWHLPGLDYHRMITNVLINTMNRNPQYFRDGYRIGSVYGTIPGAIWNGGRSVFGTSNKQEIARVIKDYNDKGIPVRFTWTNSLLEEKHIYDTYCNLIMQLGDNGKNQVLVNRPVLEEYIRENYPSYQIISSTTKRIVDPQLLKQELEKDYFLVVLDYDLNCNEEVISQIEPVADRIEILVNEICQPNCPMREAHYRDMSRSQLEYDNSTEFVCPDKPNKGRNFEECKHRPAFMSTKDVDKYIERGFVNFKIAGRGLPQPFVLDSYIYFLVKDEYKESVRAEMVNTMNYLESQRQAILANRNKRR